MAKFLTGNSLNAELESLFDNAEKLLILISPYIKLHDRYASTLKAKLANHELRIIVVFGKNEDDVSRSMKSEDFNFFKQFPNIEIRYEKRLHAKYYANESSAILTSMNLYSYSQDNNIEAGVMANTSGFLGNLITNVTGTSENVDKDAWIYFERVIQQSELLFKNSPEYESGMFGLTKKYKGYINVTDNLSTIFLPFENNKTTKPQFNKSNYSEPKHYNNKQENGFCIRTGEPIPFNPNRPYSDKAYKSWAQWENKDYPEKYCHKTGQASHGKTSMRNPIL